MHGYFHKGCMIVPEEKATIVDVTISFDIPKALVTCSFEYDQPAFDNAG